MVHEPDSALKLHLRRTLIGTEINTTRTMSSSKTDPDQEASRGVERQIACDSLKHGIHPFTQTTQVNYWETFGNCLWPCSHKLFMHALRATDIKTHPLARARRLTQYVQTPVVP